MAMLNPTVVVGGAKVALKLYKKYASISGSKVKKGAFAGASIEMFGKKACIQLDEKGNNVYMLTSDNVEDYEYVKEKKKLGGKGLHTYFYYDITFKDGTESYVCMRRKYRDAMEQYC